MKKGIKTFCKVLSVFLAVLFILEVLPTQVMAEAYTAAVAEKQFIEDLMNNPTDVENADSAEILYEVEEKRDEFTKVYKKTDGSYTAIVSKEPLHYLDNGVWEEIDNSLSSDGNTFTNASNIYNAIFPKSLDDNAQISIENGESEIAFSVNNISESTGVVENAIGKSDTQIETVDNAIANTQSSITYEDVETNTDIQYIVTPNSIKENVIVSDKNSIKDSYSFTIEKGNLTCVLADDGSVSFVNSENEVEFSIPRPVMTDAALAFSYDIDVNVVDNNDGTIELIYSPSKEWTNSNDRVYPINIDPAIVVVSKYADWIEDNCVIDDITNETDQDMNFINDFIGVVASPAGENSDGTNKTIHAEIYTKINPESFKNLGENIVFTDVQYVLAGNGYGGKIIAKEVEKSYNMETVTYSSKPKHGDEVYDYYTTLYKNEADADANSEGFVFVHFNITKAFNEWLNGETNNGFVMVPEKAGTFGMFITDGVYSYTNPSTGSTTTTKYETNLIIDYVDVNGYNELYSHHSQDVGRAGTGYVNDFTQGLSVVRNDISLDGNIMPVSIAMNYGTAVSNMFEYEYSVQNPYGNGWSPNYQRMYKTNDYQIIYYTETGSEITFNIVENDDGTTSFVESTTDFVGESGYTIEKVSEIDEGTDKVTEYYHLARLDGYVERFNDDGFLVSVSNPDYPEQQITIKYAKTGFIDCVTDGVGRKFVFDYDSNGMLSKISCLSSTDNVITGGSTTSPLEVKYSYSDNQLTKVTYADGKSINYAYDSNGHLVSMENIDGYRVVYTYDENGKVTSVKEQAKSGTEYVNGNYINYEPQSANQVKLTDALGSTEVYQFNRFGKLLYTVDNYGNYCKYDSAKAESTLIVSTSNYKANSQNFLVDPSFERYTGQLFENYELWTLDSNMSIIESDEAHTGKKVMKFESDVNTYSSQTKYFATNDSGSYTFSAYVKSDSENPGQFTIKIYSTDESGTEIKDFYNVTTTNNDWQRYTVTIDKPNKDCGVYITFGFENSHGTFLVDDVQLEHSVSASDFNLVENGSFTNGYSQWETNGNYSIVNSSILGKNVNALQFTGGVDSVNRAYTIIPIDGKKGDVYSVGAWLQGVFTLSENRNSLLQALEKDNPDSFNFTKDRFAQIVVGYQSTEPDEENVEEDIEETLTKIITIPFEELLSDWQFASGSFALECDCTKIVILVKYTNNGNPALLSNVELIRDEDAIVINEEETTEGTTEGTTTEGATTEGTTTEGTTTEGATTEGTTTEEDTGCVCEDCEEADCQCDCKTELECNCPQCKRRSSITTKDTFGNTLTLQSFDGSQYITSSSKYTTDGNYVYQSTDEDGNVVTYNYNDVGANTTDENRISLTGVLDSITDGNGNSTKYTFNAYGLLLSVSALNKNNEPISSVNYEYDNDRLTKISHNGFDYIMSYNIWGQLISVSVGSQTIISYQYGNGKYRDRLLSTTYYNNAQGTKTNYSYNNEGNISKVMVNNVPAYEYYYDTLGNVTRIVASGNRIVHYTDDRTDITDMAGKQIYSSYTNDDGDFIETVDNITYVSKSYESSYNPGTGITTEKSDVIVGESKYIGTISEKDWFGRNTNSVIKTESADDDGNKENNFASVKTEYTYAQYDNNTKTSNRVDEYINKVYYGTDSEGSDYKSYSHYSYEYDGNGNITAEYSLNASGTPSLRYSYVYDELNQLVRTNDAVAQKTYTYTYDGAGNILTKTTYPYTTGDLGTASETLNYTYDTTWTDKLMSYGTTNIEYDDIGNPTKIGDKSFTWSGRQLETYTQGNKTIEFEYDENGLRHRKTVKENGVIIERYDYVWSDGSLITQTYTTYSNGEVDTTNSAKFIYDTWGTLQGFVLNDTSTYLYTKNLQGDILSIVNESGQTIVTYEYNSWGAVSFSATSMQNLMLAYTLSFVSPFAYRGYCYDYDIELYYLQSRYYSPEIGRFINADSTDYLGYTGTVLSFNLFSYCENNPVNYVDYSGKVVAHATSAIIGAIISVLTDILAQGLTYWLTHKFKFKGFKIDVWSAVWSGIQGLATGALMVSKLKRTGVVIVSAIIGLVDGIVNSIIKKSFQLYYTLISVVTNVVAAIIGGAGVGSKYFKRSYPKGGAYFYDGMRISSTALLLRRPEVIKDFSKALVKYLQGSLVSLLSKIVTRCG